MLELWLRLAKPKALTDCFFPFLELIDEFRVKWKQKTLTFIYGASLNKVRSFTFIFELEIILFLRNLSYFYI